jgi:hypothetical protein
MRWMAWRRMAGEVAKLRRTNPAPPWAEHVAVAEGYPGAVEEHAGRAGQIADDVVAGGGAGVVQAERRAPSQIISRGRRRPSRATTHLCHERHCPDPTPPSRVSAGAPRLMILAVSEAPDYAFPHSAEDESRRLQLLEQRLDPLTKRRIQRRGIGEGARCLEIGGGRGSITRWLSDIVGPAGRVIATSPASLQET